MSGRSGIKIGKATWMGMRAEEMEINWKYNKKETEKVGSRYEQGESRYECIYTLTMAVDQFRTCSTCYWYRETYVNQKEGKGERSEQIYNDITIGNKLDKLYATACVRTAWKPVAFVPHQFYFLFLFIISKG